MVYIYQADSNKIKQTRKLEELLTDLPVRTHERALRYKFEQDAYNYVIGRLLLRKGLQKFGINHYWMVFSLIFHILITL